MPHRDALMSAVHTAEDVVELARRISEIPRVRADGQAAAAASEALRRAALASFRGKDVLRGGGRAELAAVAGTIEAIVDATRELHALLARLPSE